jgi:hypothetical protein
MVSASTAWPQLGAVRVGAKVGAASPSLPPDVAERSQVQIEDLKPPRIPGLGSQIGSNWLSFEESPPSLRRARAYAVAQVAHGGGVAERLKAAVC